jgi:hypothetical protein
LSRLIDRQRAVAADGLEVEDQEQEAERRGRRDERVHLEGLAVAFDIGGDDFHLLRRERGGQLDGLGILVALVDELLRASGLFGFFEAGGIDRLNGLEGEELAGVAGAFPIGGELNAWHI